MSKIFTLDEVNALELSAAENATILERERIIKLLEADILHHIWLVGDGQKLHDGECSGCKTIALIKGENK